MILIITNYERNQKTGFKELICSHGYSEKTGKTITLPSVHPEKIGARFDEETGFWVIKE